METTGSKFEVTGVPLTPRVLVDTSTIDRAQTAEAAPVSHTSDSVEVSQAPVAEAEPKRRAAEEAREELSYDEARKMAEELEKTLNSSRETVIRFKVSLVEGSETESNPFQFQVVDRNTGEIVRQFPPEDILGMAHKIKDDLAGLVVDSSA